MTNPKFKIGVFTFSHAAAEAIKESTYTQMDDIELQLFQHGLEDAVPIAMTIEKQGVEVVLSRRGTATLIRENLKIPVITFPVSSIDILVALQEASKFGKTILFTTFRKKLPGLEVVEKLLNINLIQGVYYDTKSMHDAFSQANKQGCQIAVGGGGNQKFWKKTSI